MTQSRLDVIALAGPNGAGKSTAGPRLIRDVMGVSELVNADVIATGLSAFSPEAAAIAAGRAMLARLNDLARRRVSFAFETTLAARSFAPWIKELGERGYRFHVLFLWLPSVEMALRRVSHRVRLGGHDVPEGSIRRRFRAGMRNFFALYRPLATTWRIYDNSGDPPPRPVASGRRTHVERVTDVESWNRFRKDAGEA